MLKKDEKLPTILSAPSLTSEDKSQIIQELQRHTGGVDKGDTVKNFLQTLADNNRLGLLEGVCEKFTDLMSAAKGELDLIVTSATVCSPIRSASLLSCFVLTPACSLRKPLSET